MNLTIERPRAYDKNDPRYFEARTSGTRAYVVEKDGTKRYFIDGTASSSVEDRYGDLLDNACQASMLNQAGNLTMWLNHSYNVPEDVAGTCVNPTLKNATADDGTPCMDLDISLEIDPENPRAMKCWQHVNKGTKLAFSIGGYFKDFDMRDDFTFIVHDVDLLEISLVGIPANPRAYTKNFGISMDRLREECKQRAAHQEAPPEQLGAFIRKSFGLPVAEMDGHDVIEYAVESEDSGDTATTPKLREADAVNDELAVVKAVTDPTQAGQIVECMKCIKNCIECGPAHALCAEPVSHARAAHAILKAMLPDDYEYPADADLLAAPAPVTLEIAPEKVAELREVWESEVNDAGITYLELKANNVKVSSDVEQLEGRFTALSTEVADLERKKAELAATPTGRQTVQSGGNPSGSSKEGSEPTIPIALYYKSNDEARQLAAEKRGDNPRAEARDTFVE